MTLLSQGQLFQYAEQQALNAVYLKTQSPAVAATYLALSQTAVGALQSTETTMAGTTINEYATSTAYARQAFAPTAATAASPSQLWNSAQITWGPFTGAPGTCYWGISTDAVSGTAAHTIGSFLLASSRTPGVGDSLQCAAGTGAAGVGFIASV
jgi:hypothetical protein